jgi:hypothetical protein
MHMLGDDSVRKREDTASGDWRTACRLVSIVVAALVTVTFATPASAQRASVFEMEIRPFGGAFSFAQRVGQGIYLGVAVGGGIDWLDRTLAPDPAEEAYHAFEQLAHVSAFMRQKPSSRIDFDLGIRVGIGGVRECTASDCWPGAFAGLYGAAFWGTDRFKVGPRVLWALARDGDQSDPVLYAELITVRIGF